MGDVVDQIAISRAGLEQKVRQTIGRTPAQEIERIRMAAARRLLVESNQPISEVARRSGFSSLEHFPRALTRVREMPPTTYRHTCDHHHDKPRSNGIAD